MPVAADSFTVSGRWLRSIDPCLFRIRSLSHQSLNIRPRSCNRDQSFQNPASGIIWDPKQCLAPFASDCCYGILHSLHPSLLVLLYNDSLPTAGTLARRRLSLCYNNASISTSHHPEPHDFVLSLSMSHWAPVPPLVSWTSTTSRTIVTSFRLLSMFCSVPDTHIRTHDLI